MAKRSKRERRRVGSERRQKEHKTGFDFNTFTLPEGVSLFKVEKEGTYKVDIIPYRVGKGNEFADPGEPHYERTYYVHRGISADNNTYCCPRKTFGNKCPICEEQNRISKDPDADSELVKSLAPKERQLWNVIDHSDKSKGIQIWDVSYHLFGKLLDSRIEKSEESDDWGFFSDPTDGLYLRITFVEGSAGAWKWMEANAIDFHRREDQYEESIIDEATVLDDLLIEKPYDKLKAIFLQIDDDDEESSEDEKDKPQGKHRDHPLDEVQDEESEEEEDWDEDEESEEETEEDTEEESDSEDPDWDEEEEEEPEPPPKKKKFKTTAKKKKKKRGK